MPATPTTHAALQLLTQRTWSAIPAAQLAANEWQIFGAIGAVA